MRLIDCWPQGGLLEIAQGGFVSGWFDQPGASVGGDEEIY